MASAAGDERIFLSFAVPDADLANALVNFLRLGCDLSEAQIFMTERPSTLPPGTQFVDAIREALDDAAMAILLLTPSYYESRFCLAEAGAVWIQNKVHVPLIVPPVDYHNLEGVQLGEQALKINSSSALDELRDLISEVLGRQISTGGWNAHKGDFLNRWTTEFEDQIAQPSSVPLEEFEIVVSERDKTEKEVSDFQEENDRLGTFARELRAQNDQLRTMVPDAPEAPELKGDETAELLNEAEAAIESAKTKIAPLPSIVKEALYQHFQGRNPLTVGGMEDRFSLDTAQKNVEFGYLSWVEDEQQMVTIRRSNPEIGEALAALDWVREMVFEGLSYEGEAKAQGWAKPLLKSHFGISDPTFELRPVWEALGFLSAPIRRVL